ncbi:MAG: hypothetical protein KAI79_16170 [Bacteroidales bacterium]|nr:hypothetical protein [Bacteroidales bacterium]
MRRLILDIDESIYDKIYWFLSVFPKKKLRIEKVKPIMVNINLMEFIETYAGFLKDIDFADSYKKDRIDYLNNKYS